MIETLAKAVYEHWINNHPTIHTNRFAAWHELSDVGRESEINKLKSVLKALETPTPEMMRAGVAVMDPEIFRQWSGDNMSAVFTAMIRAASVEDET